MKLLIENWNRYLKEAVDDRLKSGLKNAMSMSAAKDPNYLIDIIATRHPAAVAKIKKRGLTDRYIAAAQAANKQEGALLDPDQYLRQADEIDQHLGLSQEAPATAPSSDGDDFLAPGRVPRTSDGDDFLVPGRVPRSSDGDKQASSGGGKQAVTANIEKMYNDLRTYDAKFVKDPDLRKKYEAALGAINSLLRSL